MARLKGTLVDLMADISKVKADEKAIADAERKVVSADIDSINQKCELLKSIFPIGFATVKKRYSRISWFSEPTILKARLSQSAASMATVEVKSLHPEMLDFEARRLMQAECGHFVQGVFIFDLEKARTYFFEARKIACEPDIHLNESSCLKGSLIKSSKKRVDWRKQERLAIKRMLDELALQRKERASKRPASSTPTSGSPKVVDTLVSRKEKVHPRRIESTPKIELNKAEIKVETPTVDTKTIKRKSDIEYKPNTEQILRLLRNNSIRYLYHFTSIKNIPSIKKNGGLYSWDYMERNGISIPVAGGDSMSRRLDMKYNLQDFVRLSFCSDHPMAHRLRISGENIVLLMIDIRAAAFVGAQYSDMNAADSRHRHGPNYSDLERVDFSAVKRTYVSSSDPDFKAHQAEVMVRTHIPSEFILNLDDF